MEMSSSLNPYFNGIYFLIIDKRDELLGMQSLNPYFNGIYFLICWRKYIQMAFPVLILILMEYTF